MAVKVRERPPGSGKWWIFTDWKGKRSARLIPKGKRAAEQIAAKITEKLGLLEANERHGFPVSLRSMVLEKPEASAPVEPAPIGPLFKDYATQWLETCETRGLKYTTYQAYRFIVEKHLKPAFGELALHEIDRKRVKDFALERIKAEVAPRTVVHILCGLSAIFTAAIEDGLVQHNPGLRPGKFLKGVKRQDEDVNPLTVEEEHAFLTAVQTHFPQHYPFFLLLLRTGLRLGEAIALQPGDVDFRGRFIQIRRNWTRGRLTTPKSGKTRRVDVSLKLAEVLKEHLITRELEALAVGKDKPQWVFTNKEFTMTDPDNLRKLVFYKALDKAGLRHIRLHDLRHTYATRLIGNGKSLAYVRDQMGHSSIKITVDSYSHFVPGSNKQAVDRLDAALDVVKTEGQSATIRNQSSDAQAGEERFPSEVAENIGAGERNRTSNLRFTKFR